MSNRLQARVEVADPSQIAGIYQTMLKAHASARTPYPSPDQIYCMQACLDLMKEGFVGVALNYEGAVVGAIMLDYGRWPWTDPKNPKGFHLYNQHFWVEPEHRKFGTAEKLMDFAKAVARRKHLALRFEFSNMDLKADIRDRFARINGLGYTGGVFYFAP